MSDRPPNENYTIDDPSAPLPSGLSGVAPDQPRRPPESSPNYLQTAHQDERPAALPDDKNATLEPPPDKLGRYAISGRLGQGGYGVVYLGYDATLRRPVAIKVPRRDRVTTKKQADAYLHEAQMVASLEHPAIVRVYDTGTTDDGLCFVVSQYIEGRDLAAVIHQQQPSLDWAADVVIKIAEALHHAHKHRIVHRDVKPSNILIDKDGRPFLADFGLALREEDFGRGAGFAGTPRYMSPEQARGEGHRVDARSDVYSLGVVFYELLTRQVPFTANDLTGLLDQIATREPPPPRQFADGLPRELERICLKTLAKRSSERYGTAADLAEDLRLWLNRAGPATPSLPPSTESLPAPISAPTPTPLFTRGSDAKPLAVVPKGLLSYDAKDADFFLELLPGPRDRDGLPPAVRFWKARLEETDADETFPVGLLWGPSGCGKSSLVRAGLVPRLAPAVQAVVIESAATGTEQRMLTALRKHVIDHPEMSSPSEAVAWLRRRPAGPKIVLIFDQFEQWLFAHRNPDTEELTQALRQCDGGRVQALLLVRDDFSTAANRFFAALEVPLREGHNYAAAHLFDLKHARKVLTAFGRSYGALGDKLTPEQDKFLDQAVEGLAENDQVVAVRLGLFSEMVKAKPWTPAALKALGGAGGVGVAFLDEAFGPGASPTRRSHAKAAEAVLAALLPDPGANIKGRQRTRQELVAAAGYENKPAEFDALLRGLDQELRLISPTESEAGEPGYQLTHDYLVPSLRTWLGRRQRETRAGRARLLLEERAALWTAKPERRQLPSFLEWLQIRWRTRAKDWTEPQRRMMGKVGWRYMSAIAAVVSFMIVAPLGYREWTQRTRARELVDRALYASLGHLPDIYRDLKECGRWCERMIIEAESRVDEDNRVNYTLLRASITPAELEQHENSSDEGVRSTALLLRMLTTASKDSDDLVLGVRVNQIEELPSVRKIARSIPQATLIATATSQQSDPIKAASAAALLAALGNFGPAIDSAGVSAEIQSQIGHRLASFRVPPRSILQEWDRAKTPAVRYCLLVAIAQSGPRDFAKELRIELTSKMLAAYRTDSDPGIHALTRFILRQCLDDPKTLLVMDRELEGQPSHASGWVEDAYAGTMVKFGPVSEFPMGPWATEPIKKSLVKHRRGIPRRFALSSRQVTIAEYQKYDATYRWDTAVVTSSDCPVGGDWFMAARYCNYLTKIAKLGVNAECFIINDETGDVKLAPDYLLRRGYRLPTEAEWEYACRAGTNTLRFFGNSDDLLSRYASLDVRRLRAGGSALPNPFGMFDMLGNARDWCLEPFNDVSQPYKSARADQPMAVLFDDPVDPKTTIIADSTLMAVRGSAHWEEGGHFSARRGATTATTNPYDHSIRVARTLGPDE